MPKMKKKCSKCGETKSLNEFHVDKRYNDGVFCWCKLCTKGYQRISKAKMSLEEKTKWREYNRANYAKYNNRYRESKRRRNLELKHQVMEYYSNGKPICSLCGFSDIRALCIDHINNDGAEHRRRVCGNSRNGGGTSSTYFWLRKNGFPDGFQVLCFNCNQIKEWDKRQMEIKRA